MRRIIDAVKSKIKINKKIKKKQMYTTNDAAFVFSNVKYLEKRSENEFKDINDLVNTFVSTVEKSLEKFNLNLVTLPIFI